MSYTKRIVCLAKSRKFSGRCVAGIELVEDSFEGWIRPVRTSQGGEVPLEDRRFENGVDISVLDVVEIPFLEYYPIECQRENHLYDPTYYWTLVRKMDPGELPDRLLSSGPLWINGHHSYHGINDRIPVQEAAALESSLALVRPEDLGIQVVRGLTKRTVRAAFRLGEVSYNLVVTDPAVERRFLQEKDGHHDYQNEAFLCISVGEEFDGYRYKLVAAVIEK